MFRQPLRVLSLRASHIQYRYTSNLMKGDKGGKGDKLGVVDSKRMATGGAASAVQQPANTEQFINGTNAVYLGAALLSFLVSSCFVFLILFMYKKKNKCMNHGSAIQTVFMYHGVLFSKMKLMAMAKV